MKGFINFLEKYLQPIGAKIGQNKFMLALRDGFVYTLPFTLVGSIFLLLAFIPIPGIADAIASSGWQERLLLVSGVTFDLMALMGVLGISYHLAKQNDDDGFVVAVLALLMFFLLQATSVVAAESGEVVGGVIPKEFLGSKGMFTAIVVGLIVPSLYNMITKRGLTIKMPEQVPPAVAKSFSAIIPVAFVITTFWLFQIVFIEVSEYATVSAWFYATLQVPLQALGNTFFAVVIVILMTQFLWFFGIHGATVVMGVVSPIFQANSLENLALYEAGQLTMENGANLVTQNLFDSFINNGGSGMTLGIVLLMLSPKLFKSARNRDIAKLAVAPGLFTVNEPVLFGIPMILNPMLLIPFVVAPLVAAFITLAAIQTGIMPPFNGISIPWTTPPIISGFLICGFMGAVIQVVNIIVTALIYYPFMKTIDKKYYEEESGVVSE